MKPGKSIRDLAHSIEEFLTYDNGMRCEVLRTEDWVYIVQGKDKHDDITKWAGMNRNISVRLSPVHKDTIQVIIEQGKQENKYAAFTVGMLLHWGVALTSLYGIFSQRILIRKTDAFIRKWFNE